MKNQHGKNIGKIILLEDKNKHLKEKLMDVENNLQAQLVSLNCKKTQKNILEKQNKKLQENIMLLEKECVPNIMYDLILKLFEEQRGKLEKIKTIFDDDSIDDDTFFPKLEEILGGYHKNERM